MNTSGAPDSEGKGTEAPQVLLEFLRLKQLCDLQGEYDPRFSQPEMEGKVASQDNVGSPGVPSKVVTMQGSFFLDLCIQIQQAISHT